MGGLFKQSGKRFPLGQVKKHRQGALETLLWPGPALQSPRLTPKSLCLPHLVRHKGGRVSACLISSIRSEQLFFEMADRLAEDGWRELGYEYINMDDCWSAKQRDAAGQLVPDPTRFPSGIKALADYVSACWGHWGISVPMPVWWESCKGMEDPGSWETPWIPSFASSSSALLTGPCQGPEAGHLW